MRALLLLVAASACAEPVVEMRLALPEQAPASFDLSCVKAIDLAPHREGVTPLVDIGMRKQALGVNDPCVEITPQATFTGLRDELRGKFELELTDDLGAIQIRGRVGTCADDPNFHEAIFYGGALFDGGDVDIPLVPNISCNARDMVKVRPFEVMPMIADPTHACRAPIVDRRAATFPGVMRPSMLAPFAPPITFEAGTGVAPLDTTGAALIPAFASTMTSESCIAVAHESLAGAGTTCVNKATPSLCGAPGEIELPIYPFIAVEAILDEAAIRETRTYVIGTVWETNPNRPVAGATVTAPSGVKVEYIELVNGVLQRQPGATKTGPSGLFILYAKTAVTISIAAPAHQTRTLTVAGGFELPGAALAVLPRS